MKKFEYKIISITKIPTEELLNEWGEQGWELCNVTIMPYSCAMFHILKKQIII